MIRIASAFALAFSLMFVIGMAPQSTRAAVDSVDCFQGQGCCSHHGGECGCSGGRASCCDGTLSPSCGC